MAVGELDGGAAVVGWRERLGERRRVGGGRREVRGARVGGGEGRVGDRALVSEPRVRERLRAPLRLLLSLW